MSEVSEMKKTIWQNTMDCTASIMKVILKHTLSKGVTCEDRSLLSFCIFSMIAMCHNLRILVFGLQSYEKILNEPKYLR